MHTKIIVRIFGGLGNQLFCYAVARRLALVHNGELVVDDVSGFINDHTYQRQYQLDHFNISCRKATAFERLEPFGRVRRVLKRTWNKRLPFVQRAYIQRQFIDFDSRLLQVEPKGTLYLDGCWQSEDYFKDVAATLRKELEIKPPTDVANLAMKELICGCTSVAVHVRFFDEPQTPGNNNAPSGYYTRAIEKMNSLVPGAHYFIFSDQPEAARARIPLPDARLTLVAHNKGDNLAYADLWLMSHCQHFVIANSTFSWWGAWLGKRAGKQVIAPGYEKRDGICFWGVTRHLPDEWLKT